MENLKGRERVWTRQRTRIGLYKRVESHWTDVLERSGFNGVQNRDRVGVKVCPEMRSLRYPSRIVVGPD